MANLFVNRVLEEELCCRPAIEHMCSLTSIALGRSYIVRGTASHAFDLQLIDGRKRLVEVHTLQTQAANRPVSAHNDPSKMQEIRFFILFLQKYIYSAAEDTFVVVPAMPAHLPAQIRHALDVLQSINQGKPLSHMLDLLILLCKSGHRHRIVYADVNV